MLHSTREPGFHVKTGMHGTTTGGSWAAPALRFCINNGSEYTVPGGLSVALAPGFCINSGLCRTAPRGSSVIWAAFLCQVNQTQCEGPMATRADMLGSHGEEGWEEWGCWSKGGWWSKRPGPLQPEGGGEGDLDGQY